MANKRGRGSGRDRSKVLTGSGQSRGFNFRLGRFHANFSNRWLYTFVAVFVLALLGVFVYALGAVPNPGHSVSELQTCSNSGEILKMSGGSWTCAIDEAGGGSLWTSSGSDIYYNNGSVGIGTTSPQNSLNVIGSGNFTGNTTSKVDFCIEGGNCLSSAGGGLWSSSGNNLYYEDGAVGIGTNSSTGYLTVARGSGSSGRNAIEIRDVIGTRSFNITFGGSVESGGTFVIGQLLQNPALTTSSSPNAWISSFDGQLRRSTSSARYKTNIRDLSSAYPSALETVGQLRPAIFESKDEGTTHIGLIAEEVNEVIPELVTYLDGQPDYVEYSHLTALLAGAIQEQQVIIDQMKSETCRKDSGYSWC